MWSFLIHGAECFIWCGVWHWVHHNWHRWHGLTDTHYMRWDLKDPAVCICTQAEIDLIGAPDPLCQAPKHPVRGASVVASKMFRNGGMSL